MNKLIPRGFLYAQYQETGIRNNFGASADRRTARPVLCLYSEDGTTAKYLGRNAGSSCGRHRYFCSVVFDRTLGRGEGLAAWPCALRDLCSHIRGGFSAALHQYSAAAVDCPDSHISALRRAGRYSRRWENSQSEVLKSRISCPVFLCKVRFHNVKSKIYIGLHNVLNIKFNSI